MEALPIPPGPMRSSTAASTKWHAGEGEGGRIAGGLPIPGTVAAGGWPGHALLWHVL